MKRWFFSALLLVAGAINLFALDRNAFTITEYQLNAIIDRNTHVMTVDGHLMLRNDSKQPQKNVSLQVSSSLEWGMVYTHKQQLEYLAEKYTSDIDHTGSLSEAIVTLDAPVPPGGTVALDVQYGGVITADATRLTRMNVPRGTSLHSDWDQISEPFTAVRGLGHVVWYPVSIEAVSMSDGTAVSDAIAAWKDRHRNSIFEAKISVEVDPNSATKVVTNVGFEENAKETITGAQGSETGTFVSTRMRLDGMGALTPAFAIGAFEKLERPNLEVLFFSEHASIAKDYAVAAEANQSLLNDWLPPASTQPLRIIELTDPDASPYQDGPTLFTPIRSSTQQNLQLLLLPTQVAARFLTPRAWMQDGLGLFLQATLIRDKSGRDAALQFLDQYEAPLAKAEELARAPATSDPKLPPKSDSDNTLLNTSDELYLRVKSGFVFWMLHDMLGDTVLQHALAAYRPEVDRTPTYFQKLLEAQTKRDLEWFFDDWVYRDRGLPDFRVATAYSRKLLGGSDNEYQVTATIENLGAAGAEVPVLFQTAKGEKSVRVLVRAHDKGYARIELSEPPTRVVVNDGSVPESDTGNNVYQFESKAQP